MAELIYMNIIPKSTRIGEQYRIDGIVWEVSKIIDREYKLVALLNTGATIYLSEYELSSVAWQSRKI